MSDAEDPTESTPTTAPVDAVADDAPEPVDPTAADPVRTVTRKGAAIGMAGALLAGGLIGWLGAEAFEDDDSQPISAFQEGPYGEGQGPRGMPGGPGGGFPGGGGGFPGGPGGMPDGGHGPGGGWGDEGDHPMPPWMDEDGDDRRDEYDDDSDDDSDDEDEQDQSEDQDQQHDDTGDQGGTDN